MPESVGDGVMSTPSSTSAMTTAFDTWTNPSHAGGIWLEMSVTVETDGTTDGLVVVDVDESGGTTADYGFEARTPSALGGASDSEYLKVYIPPNGSYQIRNAQDPGLANAIKEAREVKV